MWAWLRPHVFYLALIAVGLIGGYSWLKEHDARLASDAQVKTAQGQIKQIQNQTKAQLQQVKTIVVQAKTPVQQVAAIPQLADVPLNARIAPTLAPQAPAVTVDLQPLMTELVQCKECDLKLTQCQQISVEKDKEITALKAKPSFWHRVKVTSEVVGIGIGIGLAISGRL